MWRFQKLRNFLYGFPLLKHLYARKRLKYSSHPAKCYLIRLFAHDENIVVWDVGANDGSSSIEYARWWPNARFYVVEALQEVMLACKRNVVDERLMSRFEFFQFAAGNVNGEAVFHVSNFVGDERASLSSSLLPPKRHLAIHPNVEFNKTEVVTVRRLDDFIVERVITAPDFLHLDVQGAELMVLEGLGVYLQKIRVIWLEVERVELYEGQPLNHDVEEFLHLRGFHKVADFVGDFAGDQLWQFIGSKN